MVPRLPAALAVAACLLLAGCSAVAPTAPTADAPTTDTPGTDTPPTAEPCPTPDELTAMELPDRPDALTAGTATGYVAAYEEATVWNSQYERRHSLVVGVDEATVLNRTEDGYVVRATGTLGFTDCQDERLVAGDGVIRTSYFLNDSVLLRLAEGDGTTDPRRNGTVVERWG